MRLVTGLAAAAVAIAISGQAAAQDLAARDAADFRIPQAVDFSLSARRPEGPVAPPVRLAAGPDDTRRLDSLALGASGLEARLRDIGVRDGDAFGGRGRVYVFAADGQRAVGYNLTRGADGWSRDGLSIDDGSFIGDAQAGVAWRQGDLQTSFGYVHREIKRDGRLGRDMEEGFVALQVSFTPGR